MVQMTSSMARQMPSHMPLSYAPPHRGDPPHKPLHPPPPSSDMTVKRIIGMTPDTDPLNKHSTFLSFDKSIPPPDPSRTLVMGMLPKKFRTEAFAIKWASAFDKLYKPRVELDTRHGKILVEFRNAKTAKDAWASPRFRVGEGKEHIRVWWYRELEEGEIAEDDEPTPPATAPPRSPHAHKTNLPLRPRHPSLTLDTTIAGPSSAVAGPLSASVSAPLGSSNDDEAMDVVSASDDGYVPEPPLRRSRALASSSSAFTTPAFPQPKTQALDPTAASFLPAGGHRAGRVAAADKPPPSPTTSHATTTAVSDLSFVPSIRGSPATTPSPTVSESTVKSSTNLAKYALLVRQKDLEARIAKHKEEIAARMAKSQDDIRVVPAPIQPPKDTSPSKTTSPPIVTPAAQVDAAGQRSATPTETKPSAESELRLRALKSIREAKKRPQLTVSSNKLPPSPAKPPSLGELAESFISETIQNAVPAPSFYPPSSLPSTPITPSFPVKTQKAILAEKQQLLEQHIAASKVLMEKLTSVKTKSDRDTIMRELRESTR